MHKCILSNNCCNILVNYKSAKLRGRQSTWPRITQIIGNDMTLWGTANHRFQCYFSKFVLISVDANHLLVSFHSLLQYHLLYTCIILLNPCLFGAESLSFFRNAFINWQIKPWATVFKLGRGFII